MQEPLSQEEIDELLITIQQKQLTTPIIELKPLEIFQIYDNDLREKQEKRFNYINELFVEPLKKVFDHMMESNNHKIDYDISSLSIVERMRFFEKLLFKSGYTSKDINDLVPKTKEEVDLIIRAKEEGFIDSKLLKNKSRIKSCTDFLEHIEKLNKIKKSY